MFYVTCGFLTSSKPLIMMWAHCMSVLLEVCCLAGMTPEPVAYHISTSSLMLQYHTTSDPETISRLPLTAISPKHSFHWQDKPAMFFIPPNHLPAKSIHLDHCLLRVFESLLLFLPHTICLSSLASSQQPSFNHFFITPPSLQPVHPHKLSLSFPSRCFSHPALNIHTPLHVKCVLCVCKFHGSGESISANDWSTAALTPATPAAATR